jgi:hypothetical protein
MPTDSNNDTVSISRTDSGFPPWLDFNSMRSAAINYLGPITSAYWTDYNEHDPGITTLEALLYATLDLGYRVNAPIVDLLTPGPGDDTGATDYFTPAQILGSNPFTITDYRKKLMDLREVRNAWLAVDQGAGSTAINGVYDVYLELERSTTDFAKETEWKTYKGEVSAAVMQVLQAHRNLCEDFNEPVVMDKSPFAVMADIELAPGASIPDIYQALIKALFAFFSPVPTYYTLSQLVAMKVPLNQVFGGRPYDRKTSHGFILDSQLPDMPGEGTQSLYLSVIYNLLMSVDGVKSVRNLNVQAMGEAASPTAVLGGAAKSWVLKLKTHELPVLSVGGTSFRWFSGGQQLTWNTGSIGASLQKTLAYSGKIAYPGGSPELDSGVPKGRYMKGLGDYYSIQNDYPEVYGIGAGGLPATVSVRRQAQAMQFKGYLLFFDQLLADYLAQLGNIRQLLSMTATGSPSPGPISDDDDPEDMIGLGPGIDPEGSGGGASGGATYVSGQLSTVPGLNSLLRFPPGGARVANTVLAYPVDAHDWDKLVKSGTVSCTQIAQLAAYIFSSSHDRDVAVAELALSFAEMPPKPQYIVLEEGQVAFAVPLIRRDFVLVGQLLYSSRNAAAGGADTVLYAGATNENYSLSVQTESDTHTVGYTFSLGQSGESYYDYVARLLENPDQYTQRRTAFLLHLMDRFAESFTDYALLSVGFLDQQAIAANQVGLMEQFLGNLPALGADRCKAYNYTKPGWDNTNTSGFEQRFKAYCGVADWRRHWLCPFEVAAAEKQYRLRVALGEEPLMTTPGSFTEPEAYGAAADLYQRMRSAANFRVVPRGTRYCVAVALTTGELIQTVMDWQDQGSAAAAAVQLWRLWQLVPEEADIRVHEAKCRAEVMDTRGRVVRRSVHVHPDAASALEAADKEIHDINKREFWEIAPGTEEVPGRLERSMDKDKHLYMDTKGFDMAIKHDIPHKPEHCRFVVSDKEGGFAFASTGQFPTTTAGRAASKVLLFLLTDGANYRAEREQTGSGWRLSVVSDDRVVAKAERAFVDEREALQKMEEVIWFLRQRLYTVRVELVPVNWKFEIRMGLPGKKDYLFLSVRTYKSIEDAFAAAVDFYRADTGWELRKNKKGWLLEKSGGGTPAACELQMHEGDPVAGERDRELQQSVVAKSTALALDQGNREALSSWIQEDERSREGGYLYRLVDKDRPRAFHVVEADGKNRAKAELERSGLIARGRKGYQFPEFCLGGDNVYFRQEADGSGVWVFRIRCRNDYFYRLGLPGAEKEWTLFESIAGYGSEDAAQQAFQANYLLILEEAMERVNFGEKDFIAWDRHGRRKAVVFVPAGTREALEQAGLHAADELVKAARAYPIRRKGANQMKKESYYFVLLTETGERDWTSAGRFGSPQDAHVAFDYFRLLLNVPGNYFIEYDEKTCHYRVGIREVLLESSGDFATPEEAWGREGVELLIGIAQSAAGLHPERRADGSWGYIAACPNEQAVHPCRYESEKQRDSVLEQLYKAAQGFPATGWVKREKKGIGLPDPEKGHIIALIPGEAAGTAVDTDSHGEAVLNEVLDLLDAVWAGLFYEDEGLYVQTGAVRVRPAHDIGRDKWEDELLRYGAWFPVLRKKGIGVATQYRLEIKLPGFAAMAGRPYTDKACGCEPPEPGKEPDCYAAWVIKTVYASAEEAWAAYRALLPLLADKGNYRPVHDTAAAYYGIELMEEVAIIAESVQTYFYPEMAARAMGRATVCLNAEGVNLVEHLLLRKADKAGNAAAIPACPSTDAQGLPFTPGADPYSFIMTAFLPAWPERFRENENRQRLEGILQREAPAHILLRILWLTPKDMCRMESSYKKWLRWLREGNGCGDFDPGEFTTLLFGTPLECLEVNACDGGLNADASVVPKPDALAIPKPNASGTPPAADADSDEWLSQINLLYCWKDRECADSASWTTGSAPQPPVEKGQAIFAMSGKELTRPAVKKKQVIIRERPDPGPVEVRDEEYSDLPIPPRPSRFRQALRWCGQAMERVGEVLSSRTTYTHLGLMVKTWVERLRKRKS